jgi:hypothetical protein
MNAFAKTVLNFALFEFAGDVPPRFPFESYPLRSKPDAELYNATDMPILRTDLNLPLLSRHLTLKHISQLIFFKKNYCLTKDVISSEKSPRGLMGCPTF